MRKNTQIRNFKHFLHPLSMRTIVWEFITPDTNKRRDVLEYFLLHICLIDNVFQDFWQKNRQAERRTKKQVLIRRHAIIPTYFGQFIV